ncbi:hypothetical protein NEOLI_000379 [Neolecta irregularis DAH-3]|uniref:Uncharacterized protein n=1 Tax=Neolecta irregularis (strain DAH-3) TaxID=1198029 RepID=A0A1U7LUT0_NEOID|nr:hypothetical protein NEOLI_000379 [Neolecta irregularis DAH-3]|eukprot:OLL26302.1 hypothetical protein NEOLI_000379 [Neolecta irregularis DAH-3]
MQFLSILYASALYILSVKGLAQTQPNKAARTTEKNIGPQVEAVIQQNPFPQLKPCSASCLQSKEAPNCCQFSLISFQTANVSLSTVPSGIYNNSLALDKGHLVPKQDNEDSIILHLSVDNYLRDTTRGRYGNLIASKIPNLFEVDFNAGKNITGYPGKWQLFNFISGISGFAFNEVSTWYFCDLAGTGDYHIHWAASSLPLSINCFPTFLLAIANVPLH